MTSARVTAGWAVLVAAVILSLIPVFIREANLEVQEHHIDHAVLMGLGVAGALLLYRRKDSGGSSVWLAATVLLPVVVMFLMAPPLYDAVDTMPVLHALYHLLFVALAALTAYAGQRFVRGVGWMSAAILEFMAFVAALGYGVAPR